MKLLTALRAELLKTKRTSSLYFTLATAALVPAIFLLNVLTNGGDVAAIGKDPLNTIFKLGAERTGLVFFPLFVILVCTLLAQIEYRNNTWKQVLAAPQKKRNIFLAKFLNINLLILLFLAANLLLTALVAVVTHFMNPSLHVLQHSFNWTRLFTRTANTYVTMLALCTFQFWLALRFRSFIVPTGVGFALWFTGMMMSFEFQSSLVDYFPYSFQAFPFIPDFQSKMTQINLTSLGYATVFLLLGFLDFRKRRLTS
ncbi:MAG: hypothetical protein JWP27_1448 [Flaviaesturariibacter sp.]|nr:hypothetical protein [Flaviaesturariibacter sp.]